jgi:DNA-binding CsgD family transcriptional regulator
MQNEIFSEKDRDYFQSGASAYYIFNMFTYKFEYIDDSIIEISGIPASDFLAKPLTETLGEIMEISHLDIINEYVKRSMDPSIHKEAYNGITINLIYNILTKDHLSKRILTKFFISEFRDDIPYLTRGKITDISHIQKDGLPHCFLVKDQQIIFEEKPKAEDLLKISSIPISRTEVNILRATASGLAPKEIATKLNVSISTLYTHRKNIRNKMKMDINAVITLLRKKGYIQ